jgi:hypothetical protein
VNGAPRVESDPAIRVRMRPPYKPPHGCRCGERWSGLNIAHCAASGCHRTFTGVTAFDKHRAGNKRGAKRGECSNPYDVGLVQSDKGHWGFPYDNRHPEGEE